MRQAMLPARQNDGAWRLHPFPRVWRLRVTVRGDAQRVPSDTSRPFDT